MNTNIHNSNGELSIYGFCCGYIERVENDDLDLSAELYFEHGIAHVRLFDRNAPNWGSKDFNQCLSGGRFWWSFEGITKARKLYRKLVTVVNRGSDYSEIVAFEQGD